MDNSHILDAAGRIKHDIADFLCGLIRIPSPSGAEAAAISYCMAMMRQVGFDEARVDRMGNLIGRIGSGPVSIAFDAHADVVDVVDAQRWRYQPFEGLHENGVIYGRGSVDQKGAIASLFGAALLLKRFPPPPEVSVYMVITVQEEDCEGLCWCHLIEEEGLKPHAVIITEPSGLAIARGQKGKVQFEIETVGVGSHGSAPEKGVNAIYKMAPIIEGIEKMNQSLPAAPPMNKGTIVVSRIESKAASLCSVPDECRLHIDRRLTYGEKKEDAVAMVKEIASRHGGGVRIPRYKRASYTGLVRGREKYFPSWLMGEEEPILRAAKAAGKNILAREPEIIVWDFSTNGVATAGLHGIPTIGFGPGDPKMAHMSDEHVAIDELIAAAGFYAAFPAHFAGAAKAEAT